MNESYQNEIFIKALNNQNQINGQIKRFYFFSR